MTRGDLVTVAVQGDFGKPRPALVIQSSLFCAHASATILPLSSALVAAPLMRVTVHPSPSNGLSKPSQIMVDKSTTVLREKLGKPFGKLDPHTLREVDRCLAVFFGLV